MRFFAACLWMFFAGLLCLQAQPLRVSKIGVDQGLPSDVVKGIQKDNLGFLWIATDEGLLRHDGRKMILFKKEMESRYIKGFCQRKNGQMLVIHDAGLAEILPHVQTPSVKKLFGNNKLMTDSTT